MKAEKSKKRDSYSYKKVGKVYNFQLSTSSSCEKLPVWIHFPVKRFTVKTYPKYNYVLSKIDQNSNNQWYMPDHINNAAVFLAESFQILGNTLHGRAGRGTLVHGYSRVLREIHR